MKKTILVFAVMLVFGISMAFAAFAENVSAGNVATKRALALKTYQEARQSVQTAKTNYDSAKNEWVSTRQAYAAERGANKTAAMALAIEKGKIFLNRTVTRMTDHLELVKSKVEEMKVLSDAERANTTADIDSDIAALSALQAKLSGITTKEQLRNVSNEIKDAWHNSRRGIARAVGRIEQAKTEDVAERAENVSAKIEARIDALKAKGIDTTALSALLSQYDSQISLAKQSLALAKEKFSAGAYEEGQAAVKSATGYLKEANKILKEIARAAKEEAKANRAAKNSSSE